MSLVRKGWASLVLVIVTLSMFEQCLCGYPQALICAKVECPTYDVVDSQNDFEIRSYNERMWMHTRFPITSTSYQEAYSKGFNILSAYINGENKQHMVIDMTAPVLTKISPSSPISSYEVYFFMPEKFKTFTPRSDVVYPTTLPPQPYVAVKRFSNLLEDSSISAELSTLKSSLKGTSWEAATASQDYTVADYNSPTESGDRVNEIMLWFTK